jgi:DMSO/TMAO reductase YedYZ molybdopterin-dependent catalytic subunit
MSSYSLRANFSRRHFLSLVGAATAVAGADFFHTAAAYAGEDPILAGRPLVRYPEKTDLILLTSRPPQLETPMHYFEHAITPNEAFFVRYHTFPPPTNIDLSTWRLRVAGQVDHSLELSLDDLKSGFSPTRFVAVNQCSGNSRGRFEPRVFGGQWGDGAMGNAEWTGVRLQDLLRRAGVKTGAVEIAFRGFDDPAAPTVPHFAKSLTMNMVADSPDILVAYEMNGQPLPTLNGFPARLVVPGWYSTYWVKHLAEITVLDHEFDSFWMQKAYRIPASPCACLEPGATPGRTVPINRMKVRSFIISPTEGARVAVGRPVVMKGIAFDGGYGIAAVEISTDEGNTWRRAALGQDLGPYSFREWSAPWTPAKRGDFRLFVRAVNRMGESQPYEANWNPSGYMRNVIEKIQVSAV